MKTRQQIESLRAHSPVPLQQQPWTRAVVAALLAVVLGGIRAASDGRALRRSVAGEMARNYLPVHEPRLAALEHGGRFAHMSTSATGAAGIVHTSTCTSTSYTPRWWFPEGPPGPPGFKMPVLRRSTKRLSDIRTYVSGSAHSSVDHPRLMHAPHHPCRLSNYSW